MTADEFHTLRGWLADIGVYTAGQLAAALSSKPKTITAINYIAILHTYKGV